jgi:hypothetical protein
MRGYIINDQILAWGNIDGQDTYEIPDDYSPERYNYIPAVAGVFDPNGFVIRVNTTIDFDRRQSNIQAMNTYMANLVNLGQLSQNNFDVFLSDTVSLVQQYLGGNGRLITWIETTTRNGYDARTSGFKTRGSYRGNTTNGVTGALGSYPRADDIVNILNNL